MCVQMEVAAAEEDETAGNCSWTTIIVAVRRHAAEYPDEVQTDLNAWADLLEGVAELHATRLR